MVTFLWLSLSIKLVAQLERLLASLNTRREIHEKFLIINQVVLTIFLLEADLLLKKSALLLSVSQFESLHFRQIKNKIDLIKPI